MMNLMSCRFDKLSVCIEGLQCRRLFARVCPEFGAFWTARLTGAASHVLTWTHFCSETKVFDSNHGRQEEEVQASNASTEV